MPWPRHSYKGKSLTGAGLSFRGLVHCLHGVRHGSMWAEIILERQLRVWHVDQRQQEERMTLGLAWESETSKPTFSDKPMPTRPHLLTVSLLQTHRGCFHSNHSQPAGTWRQELVRRSRRRVINNWPWGRIIMLHWLQKPHSPHILVGIIILHNSTSWTANTRKPPRPSWSLEVGRETFPGLEQTPRGTGCLVI